MSIITYNRKNQIDFVGYNFKPDTRANAYIGSTQVNNYCQAGNKLTVTSSSDASNFRVGAGIINNTLKTYHRVICTSNNIIYLDNNYLTLNVAPYGSGSLSPTQYNPGDIICQAATTYVTTSGPLISYTPAAYGGSWTGGWCGFLKNFGVWQVGSGEYSTYTASYRIWFPSVGTYYLRYSADDSLVISIDGTQVGAALSASTNKSDGSSMNQAHYATWSCPSVGYHTVSYTAGDGNGGYRAAALEIADINNSVGTYASSGVGVPDANCLFRTNGKEPTTTEYIITPTFVGKVQWYDSTLNRLAILPEWGTFNPLSDSENSTIRLINGSGVILTTPLANSKGIIRHTDNDAMFKPAYTIKECGTQFGTYTSNTATIAPITTNSSIAAYIHQSGLIISTSSIAGANIAVVNGLTNSDMVNQTFTYIDKDQKANQLIVLSIPSGSGYLNLSGPVANIAANSKYSIGPLNVDENSVIAGILNVADKQFTTGDQNFTLTDNSDPTKQTTVGTTTYNSKDYPGGPTVVQSISTLNTQNQGSSLSEILRTWSRRSFDPVAQVIYIPGQESTLQGETSSPNGVWVSSVDLFFSKKDTFVYLPVIVRIVEVINNVPTNKIIAESVVFSQDITIIPTISNLYDSSGDIKPNVETKFRFKDPVWLAPYTKYAITITSESDENRVYYCDTTKLNVNGQPYVELFYKSQNAQLWVPQPNQYLMFRLNKCVFAANSTAVASFKPVYKGSSSKGNINIDSVIVNTKDYKDSINTNITYQFKANNYLGQDIADYVEIVPNAVYSFGSDSTISSYNSNKRRTFVLNDINSVKLEVELTSDDPDQTPVVNKNIISLRTLENDIDNAGISNTNISVSSPGLHSNTANITVTISNPDDSSGIVATAVPKLRDGVVNTNIIITSSGTGMTSTCNIVFSAPPNGGQKANGYISSSWGGGTLSNTNIIIDVPGTGYSNATPTMTFQCPVASVNAVGKVFSGIDSFRMNTSGSGYYKNPTITIQEPSMLSNATASIAGETGSSGGNCKTRYITKRIDLAEGFYAGDLKVYLDCIRPFGTNINVYYKVKSDYDSDTFDSKPWQLMNKVKDNFSKDRSNLIEIEFVPNYDVNSALSYTVDGVSYPKGGVFNQFALKVVMTANDPTVIPVVTNLAAIAAPAG